MGLCFSGPPAPTAPAAEEVTLASAAPPPVAADPGVVAVDGALPSTAGEEEGPRLDDPSGRAMEHFFASLRRTADREAAAVTRVAHFGDSTIVADHITHTLRKKLQGRFGDAGHGFVLAGHHHRRYYHRGIRHRSRGWEPYRVTRRELSSGRYGYGGVLFRGTYGAGSSFATSLRSPVGRRVSRYEIAYVRHPRGGRLFWSLDGANPSVIDTRASTEEDVWEVLQVPDGPHELRLSAGGHGDVRVYGVVLEREGPGVVYDSLGLAGARAARRLHADAGHLAKHVAHRRPDLVVLAFGREEAGDPGVSTEAYKRRLAKVVDRTRAGRPDASCLPFGPVDQGLHGKDAVDGTRRSVIELTASQRKVAASQGCAFFDTLAAMGGPGAMIRWSKQTPPLASERLTYPTPAGYREIADLFFRALLRGFSDYLEETS